MSPFSLIIRHTRAAWNYAPRTTVPFDVELLIVNNLIELYKGSHRRLAPLATVSRTWQYIVEKQTFRDLKLSVEDLYLFDDFIQKERLQFLKSIDLSPGRSLVSMKNKKSEIGFLPSSPNLPDSFTIIKLPEWQFFCADNYTAAHDTISSTTTAVVRSTVPCIRLPLEIELYIVQGLIEAHKRSKEPGFRLSTFASVSRNWQVLIEKETYNHIKITPQELDSFKHHVRSYRKLLVKHILLEISYNFSLDDMGRGSEQVQFSKAVHALWRILSRWKTNRVAVELGIVSTHLRRSVQNRHNINPSTALDQYFMYVPERWVDLSQYFSGRQPARFDRTSLQHHGATSLPNVNAISELVIRREYFSSICPITLYEIISSAPSIESIHLERWCCGNSEQNRNWSLAFQQSGLLVPHSTKRLTYFEEFHNPYHKKVGTTVQPRANRTLLESIFNAADRLEHIAVSFAFDAQTFFDRLTQTEFKALKTLALTSSFNDTTESLLINAAEAVTKMHSLQILEVWNLETRQAYVFGYERLDRYQSRITWQSTKHCKISSNVERSWKDLLRRDQIGLHAKRSSFPMVIESLQDLLPHLKLGEQVVRNFISRPTWF
ncbi:hypothetical protein F52700_10857 [Fusarium sp. NRRL 52700]|nr:hypothetical protein F52700_10857 [Fusarium sp. NRRL 52700]